MGRLLKLLKSRRPGSSTPALTPLIVDTDFGDRDDAKAFAYLNNALDNGYPISLLGVGADERYAASAGDVSACMRHFGRDTIRIGKNKTGLSPTDGFTASALPLFPRRVLRVGDAEEVVAMYRELLAAAADNSVIFATIGRLNNVADLLASSADGLSPLTGSQLVAAKVARWVCMGGSYPSGSESNFSSAAADANYAVANWPATVPAYFVGVEVGNTFYSDTALFTALPNDSPIKAKVTGAGFDGEWDVTALMAALESNIGANWYTWTRGTNSVNASTGANTFTASGSGPHYYAVMSKTAQQFKDFLVGKTNYYKATPYTGVPLDTFAFAEGGGTTTTSTGGIVATLQGSASLSVAPGSLSCARTGNGYALAATNDLFRFFPRRSRTYLCVFSTKTVAAAEGVLFGGDRDGGGWWRFGYASLGGAWLVTFNGGSDITGGTVASNTIYKAAVVFDGVAGTCKLFINGSQIGSTYTTTAEGIAATLGSWGFGAPAGAADTPTSRIADVNIDTFSVYAGAASDSQAQALTT